MRVSYKWLSTMVDLPDDPQALVDELVRTGTEVESIERTGAEFDNIVTGQILAKEHHPNSDHLWVCKVDVGLCNTDDAGNPEPLQIVCGAQNFNEGDHVVVSLVGATLPGGITIKKSKLRGVVSCGMNCSARELGLGDDHEGIMILPEDTPVGLPFAQWYGISDTVLDCEITPNRPDCLSMEGIAVEVGALFDTDTHIEHPTIQSEQGPNINDLVDVTIDDSEICQRYCARVVRNVKVGPSPAWLAERVTAAGARSISNVVDVTNYVMFLTGHPLHAFDLGKLRCHDDGKRHIVVRAAHEGEKVITLDKQERTCTSDVGLITDNYDRPVGLAGVMGGLNSEIDENTCDVFLEGARFDPGHTSRTSRSLNLMSEASIRYERGVDRTRCLDVVNIAAALFEMCCEAEVCPGVIDVYPEPDVRPTIQLRSHRVNAIIGAEVPREDIERYLRRLGCTLESTQDGWCVVPPSNRCDLIREIDLIEEILRLWGMQRVEATIPAAKNHAGGLTVEQTRERTIGNVLRACGMHEAQSYCFARPDDLATLGMTEEGRGVPVRLINPLFADQGEMRRSLIPGLLRSVAYNQAHGSFEVALYEIGRIYVGSAHKSSPSEPTMVAGVMSGTNTGGWDSAARPVDFFDMKFIVEELLRKLKIEKVRFKPCDAEKYPWLQPGRCAEVLAGARVLGWIGNIHPKRAAAFEVEGDVLAFELSEEALMQLARSETVYQDIPTLPGVEVDLAIVVDERVTYEDLMRRIHSAGGKMLDSVKLFDVYRDAERLGEGKKSMAFSLTYRSDTHTLTSQEVEKAHERLVRKVCAAVGGELRSS